MTPLIAFHAVRPAPSWFARATPPHLFITYRRLHEPDLFERLTKAIGDEDATRTSGMIALNTLTRVRLHSGVGLLDVDPATFSRIVDAYWAAGRRLVSVELAWRALQPSAVSSTHQPVAVPPLTVDPRTPQRSSTDTASNAARFAISSSLTSTNERPRSTTAP